VNWVEVTDDDAPMHSCDDWCDTVGCRNRPDQTIADWIADALPVGDVEVTGFIKIKAVGGERCPQKACVLCNTDPVHVQEFAHTARVVYQEHLEQFDVTWDPTLTF
jgi:hypothetical protein